MSAEHTEVKRYCAICGEPIVGPAFQEFGGIACTQEHADQHVKEVLAYLEVLPRARLAHYATEGVYDEDYERRQPADYC
ncbi:MAG: hypothetical protein HYY30_10025 [Chloroflexi bacterium]|nr:hypothetical protein [Chloroflexota bacterium]